MIALVTDSTAYLTKNEAEQWNVKVVPMSYTVDGNIYHETYWDKNGDYENLLRFGIAEAKTSQSTVSAFMSAFDELVRQGKEVLCLTISSRLSGTYSSAVVAAQEVGKGQVTVFDSQLTAGGLYMLVKKAQQLIKNGCTLDDTINALYKIRDDISIVFSVSDLTQLRKSGRLGIIRQSVSTILNNKPLFFCMEGAVVSDGVARGQTAQIQQLMARIPRKVNEIIIHYTRQEEKATQIIHEKLKKAHPNALLMKRILGPVLTIHLGSATIGMAFRV